MSFKDKINKIKIKILAPATVCYRAIGQNNYEFRYCSFMPVKYAFKNLPVGDDGYCKTLYINNRRVKPSTIIPRNAFIEIRNKPEEPISTLGAWILGSTLTFALAEVGLGAVVTGIGWLVAGVAALAIVGGALSLTGAFSGSKGSSSGAEKEKYSASDNPSLSGAKNELSRGIVPVSFGSALQVFTYAQYATPLVNSGYGGNRYRVYSIPGYQNARYEDFRLGDVLLSNYRTASYSLQQSNGGNTFIGWDNAITDSFNKELTFDTTQAVFQTAIAYYNQSVSGTSVAIQQTYNLQDVDLANWTDKTMDVSATFVSGGVDVILSDQTVISSGDLVSDGSGGYDAVKTVNIDLSAYTITEYRYTTTSPSSTTRGNDFEADLEITLESENITVGVGNYSDTVEQGVNSYTGDKNEIIAQSPTQTNFCDIHFAFPAGLYTINTSTGNRERVTIQAEVYWKEISDSSWSDLDDADIADIYTRDIDGLVQSLSSRITQDGSLLTFKTPDDLDLSGDSFFECVGIEFDTPGQYLIKVLPVVFVKDSYWVGKINVADVVWRLDPSIDVVDESILPNVTQIACTFNATTQLTGEIDSLGAIARPYIKNLLTDSLEQSRNPVDVIYYLLTDTYSNPDPMTDDQIDMDSFLAARAWCASHDCLCDGVESSEIKYEAIAHEIANNNQLFLIKNRWGKTKLRVDTNEDGRSIKTFFNAENSWDLTITRQRGSLDRLRAIRATYLDRTTWSEQEITGYWYDDDCYWVPESGEDDSTYKPEKRDFKYITDEDSVKRRIAAELEVANTKNVLAEFYISREVLDLEVLDRVLVADYSRINDGISGTINSTIVSGSNVVGVKIDSPVVVATGASITIRSVDITGGGDNVSVHTLEPNAVGSTELYFKVPIASSSSIIRGSGFYDVDGSEFYHSGDIYMVGSAENLSMVVKDIDEIKGDSFTSKITCRLY